jgi:hypothetical protein
MSATQRVLGAGAVKSRRSLSGRATAAGSATVVRRFTRPRLTATTPSRRIGRSTVHRPPAGHGGLSSCASSLRLAFTKPAARLRSTQPDHRRFTAAVHV